MVNDTIMPQVVSPRHNMELLPMVADCVFTMQ
jgi:hypothetical protein